jgi:hypothetical protein
MVWSKAGGTSYMQKNRGQTRPLLLPGTKKQNKKTRNKMPGAMGLKTVKTFLTSVYSPTKARQWRKALRPVVEERQAGDVSSGLQDGAIFFY